MLTSKHRTYLVIGGYDSDAGQEIKLRREIVNQTLQDQELLNNIFEVSASHEQALAQKLSRLRHLPPVHTSTVFVEQRNPVSVKPIYKRKLRKTRHIRTFHAA